MVPKLLFVYNEDRVSCNQGMEDYLPGVKYGSKVPIKPLYKLLPKGNLLF